MPDSVIIQAVVDAGYGAHVMEQEKNGETETERYIKRYRDKKVKETIDCFLILLVFFDVFIHGTYDVGMAPCRVLGVNHVAMGLAQMLLTIAIMVINQRFFFLSVDIKVCGGVRQIWTR